MSAAAPQPETCSSFCTQTRVKVFTDNEPPPDYRVSEDESDTVNYPTKFDLDSDARELKTHTKTGSIKQRGGVVGRGRGEQSNFTFWLWR